MNPYYEPYWTQPDELEHHGVKGMKHGVKNGPPYPLDRGKDGKITKTQKKKKASLLDRVRSKVGGKKKSKSKSKSSSKPDSTEKKAEFTEKQKEELREKLLKSTDPKFIAKHMDLLDTKELKDRIDRINTETSLKKLGSDDNKKKVDKGMEWINNISKIAETTTKVAGAYTATMNAKEVVSKNKRQEESERQALSTAKKLDKIVKDYAKNNEAYADIEISIDPKTGKLAFKSTKKK